jgi:hypothetical protein
VVDAPLTALCALYYCPSTFFARRDDFMRRARFGSDMLVCDTEIKRMLTALIQKLNAES